MPTSETSVLGGKVLRRSLPLINGAPPANAPMLKRLRLKQGELAHFWNGEEPILYIASLELLVQTVRGNHYHRRKRELVYVISGEVSLVLEDIQSRQRAMLRLQPGDLGLIGTAIAHAYRVDQPGQAIEFSSAAFDPADTHPWPVLDQGN